MVRFHAQHVSRFCSPRDRSGFASRATPDSADRHIRYFGDACFAPVGIFADDHSALVWDLVIQFTENADNLIFSVRVIPKSSRSEIVGEQDGALKVKLKSPPVDGAANAELIKVLTKHFHVPKSAVEIVAGQTSKLKKLKVQGISRKDLLNNIS